MTARVVLIQRSLEAADAVINALLDYGGFDWWWNGIEDEEDQHAIRRRIALEIQKVSEP